MKDNGHQKPSNGSSAATPVLEHPAEAHPRGAERRAGPRRADESARLQARLDECECQRPRHGKRGRRPASGDLGRRGRRVRRWNTVREAFGWAYGSYWNLDPKENALRFALQSGSVNEEFRSATAAARFREGDGLCGGAWKARDLVFMADLGAMTGPGYSRAPVAQQARDQVGDLLPDHGRGEGDRHDGLLRDRDARPVPGADGRAAECRRAGLHHGCKRCGPPNAR